MNIYFGFFWFKYIVWKKAFEGKKEEEEEEKSAQSSRAVSIRIGRKSRVGNRVRINDL